jgi:hypothetical protein
VLKERDLAEAMKNRMFLLIAVTVLTNLAVAQSAPTTANLWIDTTGGSCTRQATPGAYVDGQACSSMQAAQTAALAGDVVLMKTGTYGSQSFSSSEKTGIVTYYCETESRERADSIQGQTSA